MKVILDFKNYKICEINISHVLEMVEKPDFQRLEDENHSCDIYRYQKRFYQQNNYFDIHGVITLGLINGNDKYQILDGQHRIAAYKKLLNEFIDFSVIVHIYEKKSQDELYLIYETINQSKKVELYKSMNEALIISKTIEYINVKFKPFIKNTNRPQVPNINLSLLSNALKNSELISKLSITTSDQLIQKITNLNDYYNSFTTDDWLKWKIEPSKILSKRENSSVLFSLGFYKEFEWIHVLLQNKDFDSVEHYQYNNNQKIPQQIRHQLWNIYFEKTTGNCYCCNEEVNVTNFEAGHIIPRVFGGKNEISNLKVICKVCNRDMGIMNLNDYKKQFQ